MQPINLASRLIRATLTLGLLGGCVGTQVLEEPLSHPDVERRIGATSFVSADGRAGDTAGRDSDGAESGGGGSGGMAGAPTDDAGGDGDDRTVEEGDIYRVVRPGLLANLNAYRGLQLIDLSDVAEPKIVGRLAISGSPVEMYVVGDTAFVLLNNWYGYYGNFASAQLDQWYGGVALSVDISNPAAPVVLSRAEIPGSISKSRLTRGSSSAALYVVSAEYRQTSDGGPWETRTVVASFDVSSGALVARTQLDLGGYVTDIQATPQALLVARYDWSWDYQDGSHVALIDISDAAGTMVAGAEVQVGGYVESQFNMDLYGGVLRVVSGSNWSGTRTNHLQTYDATNIQALTEIDHETFAPGEQLYATLFLADKAFFVTFLRVDPFHAFDIDAAGNATPRSEFVVSGWNDFFRPVYDDTRLVGIGVDDQAGWNLAVSLYDITNLANPEPLVARLSVTADYSWSEANWDHRAFSVLDDAVSAVGPAGQEETGLVLLPFSGWNDGYGTYTAGVQVFTFSPTSLTARDVMVHGTPVRRSFMADSDTTANLSESELSLFDTSDPAACTELGRVELAPNYTDFFPLGSAYGARLKNSSDYYAYWWGGAQELPDASLDIVSRAEHPDSAVPVASLAVPYDAQVHQSGDRLVSISTRYVDGSTYPYSYSSAISVYDVSDPTQPRAAGTLTTDRLTPSYGYDYGWYAMANDCWNCWGSPRLENVLAVPGALVFLTRHQHQELEGDETICSRFPASYGECYDGDWTEACDYYGGSITCRSLEGDPFYCQGDLQACTWDPAATPTTTCQPIAAGSIAVTESCYTYERYRYWQSFSLEVLDLAAPGGPTMRPSIRLPDGEEGVGMIADGSSVWVTHRVPYDIAGDSRPYTRYFIRPINLQNPAAPVVGGAINVPGQLIAKNGADLFTQDLVWGENVAETSIARLTLINGLAYLDAFRRFEDRYVDKVTLDGAGHALVSHRGMWSRYGYGDTYPSGEAYDYSSHLTVLDADSASLAVLSDTQIADWATLKAAVAGRAIFQVSGGIAVFNLSNPLQPFPQAFFSTLGWPASLRVDGDDIIVPAGRFGVYAFDLDASNLLDPL